MNVVYQYDFWLENKPWPVSYSAIPYYYNDCIYYVYERPIQKPFHIIELLKIPSGQEPKKILLNISEELYLALPNRWILFEYEGHIILSCGNSQPPRPATPERKVCQIFLDLDEYGKQIILPPEITGKYLCKKSIDIDRDIEIADYKMHYKNSRRYQCLSADGNVLWEEKHRGYLYTPFELKEGCVIFGTAGHGGGLYCYRLSDGKCLADIDTKGTERYCWQEDCIVCKGDRGQLIWVNPFEGAIIEELELPGILTDNSGIFAAGSYVCAVGFHKNTNFPSIYLIEKD